VIVIELLLNKEADRTLSQSQLYNCFISYNKIATWFLTFTTLVPSEADTK